jgi:hypothetical protein
VAVIKGIDGKNNSKGCLKNVINYITDKEKTEEKLISGHNCSPETARQEMEVTKMTWNKTDGRQYKHYVQSFNPKDKIDIGKAHELTKKWVEGTELFKKHEVLIATHKDTKHIHSHIVVNSVSFVDGKKLSQSRKDLEEMKARSNELSKVAGLTVPEKGKRITTYNMNKYKALLKGKGIGGSYIVNTVLDVNEVLKVAINKDDFIKRIEGIGYKVIWKDSRKNVTFENQDGKKVRSSNLEKTFKREKFSKEGMEVEFRKNQEERNKENESSFIEEVSKIFDKDSRVISFLKNRNVKSLQDLIDEVEIMYHKIGYIKFDLDKIKVLKNSENDKIELINKHDKLKKRIEDNKNQLEYKRYEMGSDKVLLETYEFMLKKENLTSVEFQKNLKVTVQKIEDGYNDLLKSFERLKKIIRQHENIIETILQDNKSRDKYKVERQVYREFKEDILKEDDFERERER